MLKIELLTKDNIAHACELARELHSLGTFGREGPPFDWNYNFGALLRAMADPNRFHVLLAHDDGYVGAVFGCVTAFLFNPSVYGVEEGWYVREGTPRRAAIASVLMREFMKWCYGRGAVYVQCGDVAAINTIGVDALYRRLGFHRFGTLYRHKREV
jgi:GNAT superfamily N-acetyltransferase